MVYNPRKLTANDREFSLNMMWVALAGSILFLASHIFGKIPVITSLATGFTAGTLIAQPFIFRQDEHFQRLASVGARWACLVPGIWLLTAMTKQLAVYGEDHMLWLGLTALTYNVAFTVARLRG